MRIAVTGATGFLGRYLIEELTAAGHHCRCWRRDLGNLPAPNTKLDVEWIQGDLNDPESHTALVTDCDAVIHAALYRAGATFRGGEGDLLPFVETNLLGTLRLIEASRKKIYDLSLFPRVRSMKQSAKIDLWTKNIRQRPAPIMEHIKRPSNSSSRVSAGEVIIRYAH